MMMLPILPLLLLGTAIYSIFLYQKGSGELLRVLAAVTAIVCLIWGFAIAHWSILLLGLVLLLPSKRQSVDLESSSLCLCDE
ncbi:hypothetical protein [Oscillatoria sp. FACHB-1406]|uniref:hypothetical protein n=1 Tax=Oscillatoria sp. FACHB-1406 TaxID=2692846 RepID=UPI001F5530AA|nr:hypothetical protein [Oscillatoria sp. FACHB-1406]